MESVISELLQRSKKSSWRALSDAIAAANREARKAWLQEHKASRPRRGGAKVKPPRFTIERRKLQLLTEGTEDVALNNHEFEVLDRFFTRNGGRGLAEMPMFRRQADLFRELSSAERASFFVGARFVEAIKSETIALWDVSALNAMTERIGSVATESLFVPSRNIRRPLPEKEWNAMCARATGSAFVGIGSPLANAASEYLLADMFRLDAFKPGSAPSPPVCFVHEQIDPPRTFARVPGDVGRNGDKAAILIDGTAYGFDPEGVEHGIVVAQRRGIGHTAFVIAGNSGPGTMAAAELFAKGKINVELPAYRQRRVQPVLITVVATDIGKTPADLRIDTRTIANTHTVDEPILLGYAKGVWSRIDGDAAD